MYLSITKHTVVSNGESRKATEEWVCKLNILNFYSENVMNAIKRCKAAVCSLHASGGMLSNFLSNLLNGFMNATNQEFKTVCATAMCQTKITPSLAVQSKVQQIVSHLTPFEKYFVALTSGEEWNGLGHSDAVFKVHSSEYLQVNAAGLLPFNTWMEEKRCNNCGETSHIRKDCPQNKEKEHNCFNRSDIGG